MRTSGLNRRWTALLASALLLAAGCAATPVGAAGSGRGSSSSAGAAPTAGIGSAIGSGAVGSGPGTSPDPGSSFPDDPRQPCDGVPEPASQELLPQSVTVVSAVMCFDRQRYLTGQGIWNYRQVLPLPPARLPTLIAGLARPDVKLDDGVACTAVGIIVPAFVVTLADGTRLRPRLPSDGCHPDLTALSAFGDPAAIKPTSETKTKQMLGDLQTTTNCGDGAKSPAIWVDSSNRQSPGSRAALPAAGSVSICYYRAIGDQQGELTRAGTIPVQKLQALWTKLPSGSRSACPPVSDATASAAVDWLMFLPTPRPPYQPGNSGASPIALLELGGCRRMVVTPRGTAGDVPAALADQLAALADRPVR